MDRLERLPQRKECETVDMVISASLDRIQTLALKPGRLTSVNRSCRTSPKVRQETQEFMLRGRMELDHFQRIPLSK